MKSVFCQKRRRGPVSRSDTKGQVNLYSDYRGYRIRAGKRAFRLFVDVFGDDVTLHSHKRGVRRY